MKLYATILALCVLGFERTATAEECKNETVQFCLDSYLSKDGLDVGHIDDDLPSWNETLVALQHRCSIFDQFADCMSGETENCPKYEGWIDAYEYLCKKSNLTLVVDYLKCYSLPIVVNSTEKLCKRVFEFKSNAILNGSTTIPKDKTSDYCKAADGFFACVNKTLTNNCGEEAAKWQWTWDRTLSMPLLKSCPGWSDEEDSEGSTSAWTIALIVVLVIITSIMILAIVFLLLFLFKKRKQRTRLQEMRRRTQTALPPPPYSAVMFTAPEPGVEPQAHLVDSSVVANPGDLGGGDAPTTVSDVFSPPPYMGDRPPVPEYDSLQKDTQQEPPVPGYESLQKDIQQEQKEGTVETPPGHPEVNTDGTNSDNKSPDE